MKRHTNRFLASVLALAALLSLAACGGGITAASMRLRRTQGTVSVSDSGGKSLPPLDNLGLYSGYGVGTGPASCAWIDLDAVKLTKLDQNSEIAIQQDGKKLDIEVKSGSLFFNVTQPLEDDETMNIRASTMLVGIRGTSGWVEHQGGAARVYLLEGKVECSAGTQTVQVNAGQMAELTPGGELVVQEFDKGNLPAFVQDELNAGPDGWPAAGVTWRYSRGVLTISGTGPMDDYPDFTAMPWIAHRADIKSVVIKNGITYIGNHTFTDCDGMTGVTIPDSVTAIGEAAFSFCNQLTGVDIPDSVASIGAYAFRSCSKLDNVTIPGRVTAIEAYVFYQCYAMSNVTIPAGVTSIGENAFADCKSLTDVYYGGSREQWERINIGGGNDRLLNATIHYGGSPDGRPDDETVRSYIHLEGDMHHSEEPIAVFDLGWVPRILDGHDVLSREAELTVSNLADANDDCFIIVYIDQFFGAVQDSYSKRHYFSHLKVHKEANFSLG